MFQEQFKLPRGIFGRLAGWLMHSDNEPLNRLAVQSLRITADDDVLEIGYGPGGAIERLAARTPAHRIVGVDPSDVMAEQAIVRNRPHVDEGRVFLARGQVERLPFADGSFSKAFSVSGFHIWESPEVGIAELWRVLRGNGLLVVCLRRDAEHFHWFDHAPGTSAAQLAADQTRLAAQGFREITAITRKIRRRVVCLQARK